MIYIILYAFLSGNVTKYQLNDVTFKIWLTFRAGKIRCTVVPCAYCVPEVVSRRMKYCVPKIFISSYLYLHCKFRSSTVTDKQ